MKGILFKPWKTKAIADSSPDFEWQTRRLAGLKEINQEPEIWHIKTYPDGSWLFENDAGDLQDIKPRFQVGETVYIKEAYYRHGHYEGKGFIPSLVKGVLFDTPEIIPVNQRQVGWHKRSPMFLPERFARRFIKITDVWAERLQSMTPEDCIAEGIYYDKGAWYGGTPYGMKVGFTIPSAAYEYLWDSINPKYPCASNPFVWVYYFQRVENAILSEGK